MSNVNKLYTMKLLMYMYENMGTDIVMFIGVHIVKKNFNLSFLLTV